MLAVLPFTLGRSYSAPPFSLHVLLFFNFFEKKPSSCFLDILKQLGCDHHRWWRKTSTNCWSIVFTDLSWGHQLTVMLPGGGVAFSAGLCKQIVGVIGLHWKQRGKVREPTSTKYTYTVKWLTLWKICLVRWETDMFFHSSLPCRPIGRWRNCWHCWMSCLDRQQRMEGLSQLHGLCEIEHDLDVFLLYPAAAGQLFKYCMLLQARCSGDAGSCAVTHN